MIILAEPEGLNINDDKLKKLARNQFLVHERKTFLLRQSLR